MHGVSTNERLRDTRHAESGCGAGAELHDGAGWAWREEWTRRLVLVAAGLFPHGLGSYLCDLGSSARISTSWNRKELR